MVERTYVGLDVHARSVLAGVLDAQTGELFTRQVPVAPPRIVDWLAALPQPVAVTYEAGPTGYVLARALAAAGVRCVVAAPSKLTRAPGDRYKTDRRDAERLARRLRLDEITAVRVPSEGEEAARELVRAREDARTDLMRARHRLSKLLLRQGIVWPKSAWTVEHERWLRTLDFARPSVALSFDEAQYVVMQATARRDRLNEMIEVTAAEAPWRTLVGRLVCLRGVSVLTAFGLTVEIGDWQRFSGKTIGSYLGLTPDEDSTGERRSMGAITKAGNVHARRLLVEAAWQQRPRYRPSRQLDARRALPPPAVRQRADLANRRLHRRWQNFDARHKRTTVAAIAVARELAGHCWSLATLEV